jgi:hypothetical protein
MIGKSILKINYGDFYKFSVSAGVLGFIVFTLAASYSFFIFSGSLKITLIFIYVILAALSLSGFLWAIKKWKEKQKILDDKLKLELDILKANKEKLINELSVDETINLFDWKDCSVIVTLKDLQKNKVRKKLNI